ncbi:MAG TPA: hypothetical protein VFF48_03995 [Brevundimonas sp.]|nr:hypothetical protein [Brevundimonas sp.]
MLKKVFVSVAVLSTVLAGAATSGQPLSASGAGYTFRIQGFVPVICRATVQGATYAPQAGRIDLGTLDEFCNSPTGYQVWAEHSTSLADAKLVVDGREVSLSRSGKTLISHSGRAATHKRPLALELADRGATGSLSIRVKTL